jgi:hypothetical protein
MSEVLVDVTKIIAVRGVDPYDYSRDATHAALAGERIPLPASATTASFESRSRRPTPKVRVLSRRAAARSYGFVGLAVKRSRM